MKFYFFTEMPYSDLPDDYAERHGTARVTLPRELIDPELMRAHYERYIDMHAYADEMGINVYPSEGNLTVDFRLVRQLFQRICRRADVRTGGKRSIQACLWLLGPLG